MTKQQTNILKGIAILMMMFLHLFSKVGIGYEGLCRPLIYIGDEPLVHLLTNACNPVPFFLILSGYGLRYVWVNQGNTFSRQGKRVLKLYVTYWLVMLIFVGLGSWLQPTRYPGSWTDIFLNVIALRCTWNYETWFLFPYVLLSMSSMSIFRLMNKMGDIPFIVVSLLGAMACGFMISRSVSYNVDLGMWALLLVYIELLFPFVLGAWLQHITAEGRFLLRMKSTYAIVLLVLLIAIECKLPTQADNSIYSFVFILLFLNIPYNNRIGRVTAFIGKYSMPMWMIHTFFCTYLFTEFIYGFRYPVIIYLILGIITLTISIPVLNTTNVISRRILS